MVDDILETEETGSHRRRMEILMDGVRDYAILLLDLEGRVLSWNDGATVLYGYPAAEVIGQSFARFFVPEEVEVGRPEAEIGQVAVAGQWTGEGWQVRCDGTRFWGCSVITALRDERGETKGFAKVVRDTTDRKQLEEELRRQAAELAEAHRLKDEFLAMLSHELRNPLAPVLNSIYVLRQAPDDPSMVEYAGSMVERQVRHMARLIDDLLEVTRLTHGKVRLRTEWIDLAALAVHAAESVRPTMKARGHHFAVICPDEPIRLEGDPVRLDQVLVNLLNNAAEFTEPGGHIELSISRQEDLAVVRVRDNGTGIATDLLPRVFDLFAQADTSLNRDGGGLGIGLTLVKRVVALHGGTIEVTSEGLGQGSEFTVRLPAPQSSPCQKPAAGSEGNPGRPAGLRILVVDDNIDMATSLSMILRMLGHAAIVAHDGALAVELAHAEPIDAALLDIGLPMLDGYEVARRIRASLGGHRPWLVAISGYGFKADRDRAYEAGFNAFLVKPVEPSELERLLQRWTSGRS